MDKTETHSPISDQIRRAIVESGESLTSLEKATGVVRASLMRFVRGDQSLRLDKADRLAEHFGFELVKRG